MVLFPLEEMRCYFVMKPVIGKTVVHSTATYFFVNILGVVGFVFYRGYQSPTRVLMPPIRGTGDR